MHWEGEAELLEGRGLEARLLLTYVDRQGAEQVADGPWRRGLEIGPVQWGEAGLWAG